VLGFCPISSSRDVSVLCICVQYGFCLSRKWNIFISRRTLYCGAASPVPFGIHILLLTFPLLWQALVLVVMSSLQSLSLEFVNERTDHTCMCLEGFLFMVPKSPSM